LHARIATAVRICSLALPLAACGGEPEAIDTGDEHEGEAVSIDAVTAVVGQKARVTAESGLRLRSGPSTDRSIILTMPHGAIVDVLAASHGWFSVRYSGHTGWAYGGYLARVDSTSGGTMSAGVAASISRAQSGVGFSYHWGGGCWNPDSSSHGACYGSCPNCSHSGTWGADCSGYVSKIWQVPGSEALTHCSHPYSTYVFYGERYHWSAVSRSNAKRGDAFVRQGHIFLFDSGDPWGSMRAYEAKGCSYGIVHSTRTADSTYRVIRRNGF
jgi:uncharacterized protein YraI